MDIQTKADLGTRAMYTIVWGKKNDEKNCSLGKWELYTIRHLFEVCTISLYTYNAHKSRPRDQIKLNPQCVSGSTYNFNDNTHFIYPDSTYTYLHN